MVKRFVFSTLYQLKTSIYLTNDKFSIFTVL